MLDFLHIFHLGYGKDCAASTIVLLSKLHHFGDFRSLDHNLAAAYDRFDRWCKQNGRFTAIDEFSTLGFAMGKYLDS